MKKIQLLVASALLILILAACGGSAPAEPEAEEPEVAEQAEEAASANAEDASGEEAEEEASSDDEEEEEMEPEMVTVTHPQGETTVVKNPETIVVFNYSALDTLDKLGIPVAGVPQGPLMPPHLEKYNGSEYVNVGSFREADMEAVNALDPDLIIVGLRTARMYEDMSAIAPTLDMTVDWANKMETFEAYLDNFAVIFDKEAEISAEMDAINAQIADVKAQAEESGAAGLIVLTSGGEVSGYGPGSRFGFIHDLLGVAPTADTMTADTHGDAISFEFILEQDPDVIFAMDRDAAIGAEGDAAAFVLDNELVNQTAAGAAGNIVYLEPVAWYLADAGLTTFPAMISDVASAFDGDIASGETRTVTDANGEVEIPSNPQRIIALDEGTMTDLIALGVTPAAVQDWSRRDFSLFLNVDQDEIASVGSPEGPNFEAMLNIEADLIIGRAADLAWLPEGTQENLEAIAPTVFSPAMSVDWQGHLTFLGEMVGKQAEAAELIGAYDSRLAEFAEAWEASGKDETVAIIRSRADSFNIYANDSFIAETVKSAGIAMPESFADIPGRNSISLEEIDVLTADNLFVMARNEDEAEAFVDAVNGPLWQFIPAVANDQAYQVNWSVWVAGWNSIGAQLVLDDLYFFLLDSTPATPNPISDLVIDDFGPQYDVVRFGGEALPVPEASSEASDACEDGFRLFDHEFLVGDPVCIPENPQRVAPLDLASIELALVADQEFIAGSTPVIFFLSNVAPNWGAAFAQRTADLPDLAFPTNLEVLVEAEPDLIVTSVNFLQPGTEEQLAAIAPTVIYDNSSQERFQEWKPNLLFAGDAMGLKVEAEALVADYDARVAALQEALGDSLDGQTVSVVLPRENGDLGMRIGGSFSGTIFNDVGIEQPESQRSFIDEATGSVSINVSKEQWDQVDADYLFIYGVTSTPEGTTEANAAIVELENDPIWNTLSVVQNDNVFVAGAHWHGFGLLSAQRVLDDIFIYLVGVDPTIPNPLQSP
ncbi:MAG: ABC transporter substrate-binding protein [Chloroflexota bacterium]